MACPTQIYNTSEKLGAAPDQREAALNFEAVRLGEEHLKEAQSQEDGTESCMTTCLGHDEDDQSSLASPREDDSPGDLEYGHVLVHSWKTASFFDDREEAFPLKESFVAGENQSQGVPIMCTAWVPVAVPFVVGYADAQAVAFNAAQPHDDAAQLWAKAEECQRTAAQLQATAEQVRSGAVAPPVEQEPAAWQQQPAPCGWHYPTAAASGVSAGRTTVMLRNIPNNYTRAMLLEILVEQGFAGCYDFIYLPMDFKRNANLGYAFLNLVSADEADRFHGHFNGFCGWGLASQKVGEVGWGEPLQGLEAHIERYRNSPVMHADVPDDHKPLVLSQGVCIPFPKPTKRLRAPRMKGSGLA